MNAQYVFTPHESNRIEPQPLMGLPVAQEYHIVRCRICGDQDCRPVTVKEDRCFFCH